MVVRAGQGHPLRETSPLATPGSPATGVVVSACDGPDELLERAGALLRSRPVRSGVILSILERRRVEPMVGRYWSAEAGGACRGAALHSPAQMPCLLSPMATATARRMAEAIAVQTELPAVTGEAAAAAAFAGRWSEIKGRPAHPDDAQSIYRLQRLRRRPAVSGHLRRAGAEDRPVLLSWWTSFLEETGATGEMEAGAALARELGAGSMFVWEDGGPVCTLRSTPPTAGVSRLSMVYTPPERRHRGYAGAAVGELSGRLLAVGIRPMLYAQLANPVANGLYRRLGFVAVAEVVCYRFGRALGAAS